MISQAIVIGGGSGQLVTRVTATGSLCHVSTAVVVPVDVGSFELATNLFADRHVPFGDRSWLFAKE